MFVYLMLDEYLRFEVWNSYQNVCLVKAYLNNSFKEQFNFDVMANFN